MSSVNRTSAAERLVGVRSNGSPLKELPLLAHLASILPVTELAAPGDSGSGQAHSDHSRLTPVLDEIARILFRSSRGHVLLCATPGVGKTTTIRAFADQVRRGGVPFLAGFRFLHIDVTNVGPEDSRACLETVFAAVSEMEQVVVCLDGIAALLKRGNGGTNKPLLRALVNRSGVKVIGTMTGWEYVEHVGHDARMLEMFTRLDVAEPSGEELHHVVAEAARQMKDEFQIGIPEVVIERTIALTSTFLLSESHPAKSIDVLRQVCEELQYERTQRGVSHAEATLETVIEVLSRRTGIPQETISGQGQECNFEQALADAVVGQPQAVEEVATELQLITAGLTESSKPASVMMFAGMTGVGKTELAKRIAELYSSSRRLQVYSMGNFTEPHSVSGIIGVPPGYVGHEEGGRLINELRAAPYSVFLLDEAEKCHPNVWKPFLNLFDEGWIVDQRGVKAYADRAIFILTTNAGDRNISQLVRSGKSPIEISQNVRQALSRVRQERSSQPVFPPQFLSRMKRIIVFNPLDEAAMIGIAECVARRLCRRWQTAREKSLILSPELVRQIGRRGHEMNEKSNGQEGGRIVQKLLSDHVEHAVYQKSLEDREEYARCREIHVSLIPAAGSEDTEDPLRTEITFPSETMPPRDNVRVEIRPLQTGCFTISENITCEPTL